MSALWLIAPFWALITLFVIALCKARDRKPLPPTGGWRN